MEHRDSYLGSYLYLLCLRFMVTFQGALSLSHSLSISFAHHPSIVIRVFFLISKEHHPPPAQQTNCIIFDCNCKQSALNWSNKNMDSAELRNVWRRPPFDPQKGTGSRTSAESTCFWAQATCTAVHSVHGATCEKVLVSSPLFIGPALKSH